MDNFSEGLPKKKICLHYIMKGGDTMKCKKKTSVEYHIILTDDEHTMLIGVLGYAMNQMDIQDVEAKLHMEFTRKFDECLCRAGEDILSIRK